ncbi:MAG TPA: S8 family serine peptidase [Bacteroidia bacterium]|nr:S8 family serine peptidase [Bacteroidia bacterium]
MSRKPFTFIAASLIFCQSFAQDKYVVQLANKNNSPFSFAMPSSYLSARAILRRTNQNVALDSLDLPVNPAYFTGIANTGAAIIGHSKWLNTVTIQTTSSSVLNAVNALPYVNGVTNVGRVAHPDKDNDQGKFGKEVLLKNKMSLSSENKTTSASRISSFNYGLSLNQIQMLGGDDMHNNGYTGAGMQIAVIDAGFSNANNMVVFDSLYANNQVLGTYDFVSDEVNVYDDHDHGSYCLSIMAGNWPGNLVGTAPKASYWLLRSEDAATEYIIEEYNWAEAAEYADSAGADLISTSLGYTEFDDPSQNHTYADLDGNTTPITIAQDIAAAKGMIAENSAGNEGNGPWFYISAPADADSNIVTGAVDDMGNYVSFSSTGPTADGRIKPDVVAQGQGTIVADVNNFGVFPGSGTSFSGPLITGMAACLWQCHPAATNMQIIASIRHSASQFNNPDSMMGYGIPNFPAACIYLGEITNTSLQGENIISGANPFTSSLEFSFYSDSNQTIDIRLYDLLGKLVYKTTSDYDVIAFKKKFSIPANSLAKGLYVLKVVSEKGSFSRKVMKY